jgi:hypothetical protein
LFLNVVYRLIFTLQMKSGGTFWLPLRRGHSEPWVGLWPFVAGGGQGTAGYAEPALPAFGGWAARAMPSKVWRQACDTDPPCPPNPPKAGNAGSAGKARQVRFAKPRPPKAARRPILAHKYHCPQSLVLAWCWPGPFGTSPKATSHSIQTRIDGQSPFRRASNQPFAALPAFGGFGGRGFAQ